MNSIITRTAAGQTHTRFAGRVPPPPPSLVPPDDLFSFFFFAVRTRCGIRTASTTTDLSYPRGVYRGRGRSRKTIGTFFFRRVLAVFGFCFYLFSSYRRKRTYTTSYLFSRFSTFDPLRAAARFGRYSYDERW